MKYTKNYRRESKSKYNSIECGICGKKIKKSDAVKDPGSFSGYLCEDCYHEAHIEYFSE